MIADRARCQKAPGGKEEMSVTKPVSRQEKIIGGRAEGVEAAAAKENEGDP